MKLKKLSKEFHTTVKPSAKLEQKVDDVIQHLLENAVLDTPYSIINIYGELSNAGLLTMNKEGVQVTALALQRLIHSHGWNSVSQWGFFVCGRGDPKLREIIDGSMPYGFKFTVSGVARGVEKLVGRDIPLNSVRKTLDRLVESGEFIRPKPGQYQRIHRGF
jgi:hypothetical protein